MLDVERTETEWARLGAPGRDEAIVFDIVARSFVPVPNQTTRDVWLRLAALSAVVEGVVYNAAARSVTPLGFDGEVLVGRASGAKPAVWPTPEGPMGAVVNTLDLLANL